jgi:hypothetical protein
MQDVYSYEVLRERGDYEEEVNNTAALALTQRLLCARGWP